MAITLLEAGLDDFMMVEKAESTGGTWRDSTCPGCACDVPSHLYSYSFAQHSGWSRRFASQAEIPASNRDVAGRHDLDQRIHYATPITAACTCRRIPGSPAVTVSKAMLIHTARWRHDVDLAGKRAP